MLLHCSDVHGVASREALVSKHNLFGALDGGPINHKHFIHYIQERIKSGLDVVPAIDCDVTVEDFLQYFCVSDEALTLANELL
jgi:hypothetical protein